MNPTRSKSSFLHPNLQAKGRLVRGLGALALALAGAIVVFKVVWLGLLLLISAGFVLFEALRGWCFLRACGIKTRL